MKNNARTIFGIGVIMWLVIVSGDSCDDYDG
jgi:hypothetical protein